MDNILYIADDTDPSQWWVKLNELNSTVSSKDSAALYLKIFKEYNATPIIEDSNFVGISFSSAKLKTKFISKYG